MKTKLTIVGIILFVTSFFLPAFWHDYGYTCAWKCILELWNPNGIGSIIYFFPFTFSNLLMIILPIALLTKYRDNSVPKSIICIQAVLLLHVLSWLYFVARIVFGDEVNFLHIEVGYYVWLLSMVLILYAAIRSRKSDPYSLQKKGNGKFSHLLTRP